MLILNRIGKIEQSIVKEIQKVSICSLLFMLPNIIHVILSNDIYVKYEIKELFRILGIFIIIISVLISKGSKETDLCKLSFYISIFGGVLAINAIFFSYKATLEEEWMLVEGLARAGEKTGDPNGVGAFFNLATFFCVYLIIFSNKKIVYAAILLVIQVGRLYTFSTGSLISIIISSSVLLSTADNTIIKKKNRNKIVLLLIVAVSIILLAPNLNFFIARMDYTDERFFRSSIGSRLEQYNYFFHYLLDNNTKILTGMSISEQIQVIKYEIHNSTIRAFASGGIIKLICYLTLNYFCLKKLFLLSQINNQKISIFSKCIFSAMVGWIFQAQTLPSDTSIIQWSFFLITFSLPTYSQIHKKVIHEKKISNYCL